MTEQCTHHHATPPEGTSIYCVRCDQNGRTKLMMKFAAAAKAKGFSNIWDAQELISIADLEKLLERRSVEGWFEDLSNGC